MAADVFSHVPSTAWTECLGKIGSGELPSQEEVSALCSSGLIEVLATLVYEQMEDKLETLHIKAFWDELWACKQQHSSMQHGLLPALQGLAAAVTQQSEQLSQLAHQLLLGLIQQSKQQQHQQQHATAAQHAAATPAAAAGSQEHASGALQVPASTVAVLAGLCHKHRTAVTTIMLATAPLSLPGLLQQYYQQKLHQLCAVIQQQQEEAEAAAAAAAAVSSEDTMAEPVSEGSAEAMSEDQEEEQQHGGLLQSPASTEAPAQLQAGPDPLAVLGADWAAELSSMAQCLQDLGLTGASEEAYTRVINSYVLRRLRSLAAAEVDTAVLPRAQRLVCAGPLTFLQLVLAQGSDLQGQLQEWQLRLTYLMLETLGALRSSDMFDIVVDFPDSAPALQDLALCLQHTNMAPRFAATFKAALQQRLLHAGAATADIIHTYVCTIRAMKLVDCSGLLLDIVSEPIRSYLRSRSDTVRCIVSMLTDDAGEASGGAGGQASLLEELQQGSQQLPGSFSAAAMAAAAGLAPGGGAGGAGGAGDAAGGARGARYNWCVSEAEGDEAALRLLEALEAAPESAAEEAAAAAQQAGLLGLPVRPAAAASAALLGPGGRPDADVVSSLIGIYGGPLLFMEQYRSMLAERLLAKDEYDCEREIRTLELLKIRFGDAGLHPCEVMLKDLADSKRLDANVRALSNSQDQQQQQQPGGAVPGAQPPLPPGAAAALARCRATICSYLFWPELPEHDLKLPPDLQTALEVYAERFRHLKAPRKLLWRPTMGLVELRLTVGDSHPLDFSVTPIHAALLMQFADEGGGSEGAAPDGGGAAAGDAYSERSLSAGQLAAALGIPAQVVRRKAIFWLAAGVLLERRGPNGEALYSRATSIDPSRIVSREDTDMSWREDAGGAVSAEDRILAEMGPYENCVVGLLTNAGPLGLDRLHNLLRVFVVGEPKYEGKSQEQLAAFLQVLVSREKIEMHNGMYRKRTAAAT